MLEFLLAAAISVAASTTREGGEGHEGHEGTRRAVARAAPDLTTLRGSLGPVTALRRADGEVQGVAVLHVGDAPPVFVILGPLEAARDLRLAPGARVVVRGRAAVVAGRPALVASSVERTGGREPPARTARLAVRVPGPPISGSPTLAPVVLGYEVQRGVFEGLDEVVVAGRRLQRVRLGDQVLLLDAPRWALEALRLRAGDRLEVAGRLVALGGRPVIVVDRLRAGDDPPVSCGWRAARAIEHAITVRRP